jgi:hypothetical protein
MNPTSPGRTREPFGCGEVVDRARDVAGVEGDDTGAARDVGLRCRIAANSRQVPCPHQQRERVVSGPTLVPRLCEEEQDLRQMLI